MVDMAVTNIAAVQQITSSSDETELILAARQGDAAAFNQLVLSYQERIYNLSARILGDPDLAEDVTQNTFLAAYLNLARFRNGSFRSWLYRIATNACYDVHRQHKRHPVLSIDNSDLAEEKLSPVDDFSSFTAMPEEEIEAHELARLVQAALNQLDIDHRSVVILIDQLELDYREAAQILRIPVGTVKSRLARARLRLRRLIINEL